MKDYWWDDYQSRLLGFSFKYINAGYRLIEITLCLSRIPHNSPAVCCILHTMHMDSFKPCNNI